MPKQQPVMAAGVDGCKAGWFVAIASAAKQVDRPFVQHILTLKNCFLAGSFTDVLSVTSDCNLVCVDIPVGLSDSKQRQCDLAAREILGKPRASSVFTAPIRPCLSANDYETASRISFKHSGKKLNKQSFFIMGKIRQVDDLMTPRLQTRVREVHPEISFWALNGKKPMRYGKRKLPGRNERIKLLSCVFPEAEAIVAKSCKRREVAADDILDALVAAWTASQAVMGEVKTLPENPEINSKGLRMEILCPASPLDNSELYR